MNSRRVAAILATFWLVLLASPSSVSACSSPFERPTIRALGPAQLVVVGTVGERVPGGRLFHVESWFNGGEPDTPIVIGFKEGEAVGDCSYTVSTGERKIVAPWREPGGGLYVDLATLQADPASDEGRRYIDEATALFGPGVVPEPPLVPPATAVVGPDPLHVVALVALVTAVAGILILSFRRP